MSILLYDFKELTKSIEEVERIEGRVNNTKKKGLMKKEEHWEEAPTTTLDSYFLNNNKITKS